jgi:hypothetical protein
MSATSPGLDTEALESIPDPAGSAAKRRARRAAGPASWDAIAARLGPTKTRGRVRAEYAIALGFAVTWAVAFSVAYGLRERFDTTAFVVQGVAPLVLAALAMAVALAKGPRGLGSAARPLSWAALLLPALFAGAILAIPALTEPSEMRQPFPCVGLELAIGGVPGLVVALVFRNASPRASSLRVGLMGLGAGLLAASAWSLHCPDCRAQHVLLSHGLPAIAVAALAGAVAGLLQIIGPV